MADLDHLRRAVKSVSSGWVVLMLVGVLYGLSILGLLPLELGFAGSAAILLAAHFVLRDVFGLYGQSAPAAAAPATADVPDTEATPSGIVTSPTKFIAGALAAIVLFIGFSMTYRIVSDARREQALQQLNQPLLNPTAAQLAANFRPDSQVMDVSISFESASGRSYTAVFNFVNPNADPIVVGDPPKPSITLSSKDKDVDDFKLVQQQIEQAFSGSSDGELVDGDDDIVAFINTDSNFTQRAIADKVSNWFEKTFKKTNIDSVDYISTDTR